MNPDVEVERLLAEHGAVLARGRKHQVWRLPNGQMFTRASTPGDVRAGWNQLADLRRALGLEIEGRGVPGERREKKVRRARAAAAGIDGVGGSRTLADQLRVSGVVEAGLTGEMAKLEARIKELEARIKELEARECGCWWCRVRQWAARRVGGGRD
jgi:hypothetical protein